MKRSLDQLPTIEEVHARAARFVRLHNDTIVRTISTAVVLYSLYEAVRYPKPKLYLGEGDPHLEALLNQK